MHKLVYVLNQTDLRTIINYIQWNLLSRLLPDSTAEMREIAFKDRQFIPGPSDPKQRQVKSNFEPLNTTKISFLPRNATCTNRALFGFGMALSKQYVDLVQFSDHAANDVKIW